MKHPIEIRLDEDADEFEREVATLGGSERFMNFLWQRSKEKEERPLKLVKPPKKSVK